ncbi:MAG: hypothetical protein NBV63_02400 [Candidatus Pacebacteria bacterium]|nr:hypothetical protein [Candidatus Paceibacterota bacterium]
MKNKGLEGFLFTVGASFCAFTGNNMLESGRASDAEIKQIWADVYASKDGIQHLLDNRQKLNDLGDLEALYYVASGGLFGIAALMGLLALVSFAKAK